jgi:hypothetical protein
MFGTWLGETIHQSKGSYYGSGESYVLKKHILDPGIHDVYRVAAFSGNSETPCMFTNGREGTTMWPSVSPNIYLLAVGKLFFCL